MIKNLTISILLVFVLALSLPNSASAQNYHQAISTNPLGLIWGMLNATYEQQIAPKNTFTVNATYWSYSTWWTGISVGGSYRFYLMQEKERAIKGFSFGPLVSATFWSWDGADSYGWDGGTSVSIGAEANYKWIFEGGWTVEPTFRLFFPLMNIEGLGGLNSYGFGANVGYAW
jgi:hypothetical protein